MSEAAQFEVGTRVHVEFDGVITNTSSMYSAYWRVKTPDGIHFVDKESSALTVIDPENWPPQPGDVWEADGTVFFIHREAGYSEALLARRADTGKGFNGMLGFAGFKKLAPVLRFRES